MARIAGSRRSSDPLWTLGKDVPMTRIIEHRQDAAEGEEIFELRVFKLQDGDVRACVVPADLALGHGMMEEMSEHVVEAFLDALALCEKERIAALWIHDSLGLFPPSQRPARDIG
jgi:hypothetical protein